MTERSGAFDPRRLAELFADSVPVQVLTIVGAYRLLRGPLAESASLPPSAYESASPLGSLIHHPGSLAWALAPTAILLLARRPLRWEDLDPGRRTRGVVLTAAGVLCWTMVTLGYNFYYDRFYAVDRVVLLALLIASWYRPVFVPLLASALLIFGSQVDHPLPESTWIWVDKRLPVDLLLMAVGLLVARRLLGRMRPWVPLFACLSLTGATYLNAAVAKLGLGPTPLSWLLENETSNLLLWTHVAIGFVGFLELETVETLTRQLRRFDVVLGLVTLTVELSGLVILVRRRLTIAVLLGFIVLHLGIVASSGIFFWKWILIDLSLLWCLRRLRQDGQLSVGEGRSEESESTVSLLPATSPLHRWLFPSGPYATSAVTLGLLLAAGRMWWPQVEFAWWDTRHLNYFAIYGVDADGGRHRLGGELFAPYDILVHQSRFYTATRATHLTDTTGTAYSYDLFRRLKESSLDELDAVRAEHARALYRDDEARRVREFFGRFTSNAQTPPPAPARLLSHLAPPFHFRHTTAENAWTGTPPLEEVVVDFDEHFYDGRRSVLVSSEEVMRIPLGEDRAAAVSRPVGEDGR